MTDLLVTNRSSVAATVRSAGAGDEVAFARLVAEHHASMSRVAYVVCGDVELTRDAVQAAWATAWRKLGSLRDPDRVASWLLAITANEARQAVRSRRRRPVVDISEDLQLVARSDPADGVGAMDLAVALGGLRPDERALIALRYEADLDSSEIGRLLGVSAGSVRGRLARLRDQLRTDLALDEEIR